MKDQLFDLIKQGKSMRQVQLVLESGHDANCFNERQETPLMAAMIHVHDSEKRQQLVRMLMLYKADVNCRNRRGQTPFMYACILNQQDTLNILLNVANLGVNSQDFEGNTAVMYACALGHTDVLKMVVAANETGAITVDPAVANHEGATAEDYAMDIMDDGMLGCVRALQDTWALRVNRSNELRLSSPTEKSPDTMEKLRSKERITLLAETLEKNDNPADPSVIVWKEDNSGKPKVITLGETTQQQVESGILKKKSVLNIHLPRAYDERFEDKSPENNSRSNSVAGAAEVGTTENCETIDGKSTKRKNKRRKTKARKKNRIQTRDSEVIELSETGLVPQPREFGNEIAFCNKIYGTDLYPCDEGNAPTKATTVEEMLENITSKVVDNLSGNKVKTVSSMDTAKRHFSKLSAKDRARFLSRTIWSVYGEPLPPIPISTSALDRILSGIAELRQYLSRAKYQPGRLLSLDPELWCIIESIRGCTIAGVR